MRQRMITVCAAWLFVLTCAAQKEATVEGEYQYMASPSMSPIEAKAEAVKHAQTEAIAERFGRIVTSNSYLGMDKTDGEEHTTFSTIGESEVKGEWLRDLEPPKIVRYDPQEDLSAWITVRVKGVAREIVSAPVRFESRILRNGTDDRFESNEFKAGDKFYMSFRSPESGYLTVYMIDDEGQAYRLLPYASTGEAAFRVEHDRKYTLFTKKDGGNGLSAFCRQDVEFNHIYTIFSPTKMSRALDDGISKADDGTLLPPQLSLVNFQKWFVGIRKYNKELSVNRTTIKVKK